MAAQRTPLFPWHRSRHAAFAEFGGFEMPLWYQSAKSEHLSVLTRAGVFDTSHMSAIRVSGADALSLLQYCFSNNIEACMGPSKKPLTPGRCVYGIFPDENGHVLDDAICFMLAPGDFLVVINAGMGAKLAAHLDSRRGGRNAVVECLDGSFGKMDLQGPLSGQVLKKIVKDPDEVFKAMPYFSFKGGYAGLDSETPEVRLDDGTPILLSRTGYTGEFGFEIFTTADAIVPVWERILAAGEPLGIEACGLAARDSLRAGAVLPLSHQDIGDWPFVRNPWPFALPWARDGETFSKSFLGDRAILAADDAPYTRPFVGYDLRKVSTPATVIDATGSVVGKVLTCVSDMGIGRYQNRIYSIASPDKPGDFAPKGLCCGFVMTEIPLNAGETVELKDERRKIKVVIVEDIRPDRTARLPVKDLL
ncbi:MAG: aminomethyltransferase family protein [Desulfobacterales bacterium]